MTVTSIRNHKYFQTPCTLKPFDSLVDKSVKKEISYVTKGPIYTLLNQGTYKASSLDGDNKRISRYERYIDYLMDSHNSKENKAIKELRIKKIKKENARTGHNVFTSYYNVYFARFIKVGNDKSTKDRLKDIYYFKKKWKVSNNEFKKFKRDAAFLFIHSYLEENKAALKKKKVEYIIFTKKGVEKIQVNAYDYYRSAHMEPLVHLLVHLQTSRALELQMETAERVGAMIRAEKKRLGTSWGIDTESKLFKGDVYRDKILDLYISLKLHKPYVSTSAIIQDN